MPEVSILRTDAYHPQALDAAVQKHFSLLGVERLIKPGLRVVLKPNLLMRRAPAEATTTHPELVGAVARWLKARGVTDIMLADSPGGPYTKALLGGVYAGCGMTDMARREGIALNLDTGWKVRATSQKRVAEFNIITPVAQADLVINLCKLKTHCMTGLSGAVKNLFGCIPGLQKPEFHYRFKKPDDFCDMLVDLCETVRPAITLVDAVDAMEGDGPSGGAPIHLGLTLCAANPYALDVALCALIRMEPEQAGTVKAAETRGLAPRLEEITLLGEPELLHSVERFALPRSKGVDFNTHLPRWLQSAANAVTEHFFVPRPVVTKRECVGCGKCKESCPADAITIREKKAAIHPARCIKCYCCHEMCPFRAIHVSQNRLFRL